MGCRLKTRLCSQGADFSPVNVSAPSKILLEGAGPKLGTGPACADLMMLWRRYDAAASGPGAQTLRV